MTIVCGWAFTLNSKQTVWTRGTSKLWASAGGAKRTFSPYLEIGIKNQNFLENLTSAYLCRYGTRTAQDSGSMFWCHAMVISHFTHVRSFACRGRLSNLWANCFTVGVYCLTITWQKIFQCSLQVAILGFFSHVAIERKNSLVKKESGSPPLNLESKHRKHHSWKIVSAAVLIVAHDGIGLDIERRHLSR